jgi:tetratricopeptide (TPR) repeat protein
MGVVYLARDPVLGRTLAIKVLMEDNDELRERFAREARSAAALNHTNIVTVYDVGEHDGRPFMAMQYLDGETMAEMIRRRAVVPLARKLELMAELCDGLGYAHRCGIVHRDIKPANLMITTEGTLKILDFGIARVATDATNTGLTQVGAVMGTTHYMSPEQADGLTVDERSDIFAVGLVFYELLSFARAFPGELAHVVLHNIVNKEPRALHELQPEIDPRLEQLVNRCLVKDPGGRYQILANLASDLDSFRASLDRDDETLILPRETGPDARTKPAGSRGRSVRNWQEIDERRSALIEAHLAQASRHLQAGQLEDAINECEQALVISPDEARVLALIQRAHRAVDDRRVEEWLTEARGRLAAGAVTDAERLIGQVLALEPDSTAGKAVLLEVKERRREQERAAERARAMRAALSKAVTSMNAGAFEAAMRSANEALAFDATNEEARQLLDRARAGIEQRQRELREAAERQRLAEEQARIAAEQRQREMREAEERQRLAEEQARLAREQRQRELHEAAERQRLAEEQARIAAERRQREIREATERQRLAEEQARLARERREPDSELPTLITPSRETETRREDARTAARAHAGSTARIRMLIAAVVFVALGGAAAWWALKDKPVPGTGETGGQPSVDFSVVLADAERQQENALAAIALIRRIPENATEFRQGIALLRRIRDAASTAARSARSTALGAKSETQGAFKDGEDLLKKADVLTDLADTEAAVKLYATARQAFVEAVSADLAPPQLLQLAQTAYRAGKRPEAIEMAVRAAGRDGGYRPAVAFLDQRRREAAAQTQTARSGAATAGSTPENSTLFTNARATEQQANGMTTPAETQSAVDTYSKATRLYEAAASEARDRANALASALKTELEGHVQRAELFLKQGEPARAREEIAEVQKKSPNYLATRHPDLSRRVAAAETVIEIEGWVRNLDRDLQSGRVDGARAELERIRSRDPGYLASHPDLERRVTEAEAAAVAKNRTGAGTGIGGGGVSKGATGKSKEVIEGEIKAVLSRFSAEASRGREGDVSVVCRPCEKDKTFGFTAQGLHARKFESATFQIVNLEEDQVTLVWSVVVTRKHRSTDPDRPENQTFDVTLNRAAGGWLIAAIRVRQR